MFSKNRSGAAMKKNYLLQLFAGILIQDLESWVVFDVVILSSAIISKQAAFFVHQFHECLHREFG